MKGFNLLIGYRNEKGDDELGFQAIINKRIQKLLSRLENIDSDLAALTLEKVSKKRSQRLYFTSLGQIAAYKCVIKSLDYHHVVDYLCMALGRIRIWQNVSLTC